MILRVTVNDNDYGEVLERFMNRVWDYDMDPRPVKDLTSEEIDMEIAKYHRHHDILRLISPHNSKGLTPEDRVKVIEYVKYRFNTYVNAHVEDEVERGLLIRDLEVRIQDTFVDKWENGEAFYWFQHSNCIINQ